MDSFPKNQHLCSRKAIEALFGSGNRCISAFPLRVIYKPVEIADSSSEPIQVLFSVSKRRFKHAVDRNRAKRQMREAWRQHRHILYQCYSTPAGDPSPSSLDVPVLPEPQNLPNLPETPEAPVAPATPVSPPIPPLHIAFLWLSETPLPSALVQRKMKKLVCAVSSSFPSAFTNDSSPR